MQTVPLTPQIRNLTVLALSHNTNSFGLHSLILIDIENQIGHQVLIGYLACKQLLGHTGSVTGKDINVPHVKGEPQWHSLGASIECPRPLGPVPDSVLQAAVDARVQYDRFSTVN